MGDAIEQSAFALIEPAAIETEGGGGQAHDFKGRIDSAQVRQELAVHGIGIARDHMGFVDEHHVDPARQLVGFLVDRLDGGEHQLRADVAPAKPCGIDPPRRIRPKPNQLGRVLLHKLADMGQHQNAGTRVRIENQLCPFGDHQALARAGWQHHKTVALPG